MTQANTTPGDAPAKPPERLLTFKSGGWVVLLAVAFTLGAAALVLWPALSKGWQKAVGDGAHVESYGFDLSTLLIDRAKIEAAGVPKDGIRAILPREVETMSPADVQAYYAREHRKLVVDTDRVIGVEINGEARAYPLRILVQHEVCNDVLGNTPIAVTYSPLCDSAVVFARDVGGFIREFKHSGLLYNSAPLYFDKQPDPKAESLWGQLQFKAVAGPAAKAGLALSRIDYALTTWAAWKAEHPATRVLAGVPRLRDNKVYDKEPFNTYFVSDELKFRVDPLWNHPRLTKKLPIVATQEGEKWVVRPADDNAVPGKGVHAFVFAWYAAYPGSDFSALEK